MNNLRSIVADTGSSCAAIMLPDEKLKYMYCFEHFAMPDEWVAIKNPFDQDSGTGNIHVYKTGRSVINNEFQGMHYGYHQESYLIVPIYQQGAIVGTLELVHTEAGKKFSQKDLEKAIDFTRTITTEQEY